MALLEDQESVEVFSTKTDVGSADKLTVGAGVEGVVGVFPPPPPPPQEAIINKEMNIYEFLYICKNNIPNFFYCKQTKLSKSCCVEFVSF